MVGETQIILSYEVGVVVEVEKGRYQELRWFMAHKFL